MRKVYYATNAIAGRYRLSVRFSKLSWLLKNCNLLMYIYTKTSNFEPNKLGGVFCLAGAPSQARTASTLTLQEASGRPRTLQDASGSFMRLQEASGRLRTPQDASGRFSGRSGARRAFRSNRRPGECCPQQGLPITREQACKSWLAVPPAPQE